MSKFLNSIFLMTWLKLLEYISKNFSYGCKAGEGFDSMHVHDWNKVIVITNYRIPKILQNVNWRIHVSLFLLANLRFVSTVFNTQICDFHRSWSVVTDQLLWLAITFAGRVWSFWPNHLVAYNVSIFCSICIQECV